MPKARAERPRAADVAPALFAALADPTRLALLQRLTDGGPASISALAERVPLMTRQAVTKHLRVLAATGVIDGHHRGREHVWSLNPARLADARRCLDLISKEWDAALTRLARHVESGSRAPAGVKPLDSRKARR
jgi:DNA-binding transcriptional ArsR family regulator